MINLSQISSTTFCGRATLSSIAFIAESFFSLAPRAHIWARLYIFTGAHVDKYREARVSNYDIDVRARIYTHARVYIYTRANIII